VSFARFVVQFFQESDNQTPLARITRRMPFSRHAAAAQAYGQIIAQRGWARGRDYDRMIAAHAIASGSVLATDDSADLEDVPGLSIENWAAEV
jgi:predicted nucleic acid-binding protein